ncbi:uncharacterized protein LOC112193053 isoform X1 [Rosa chinensis]|uniref:uncharacterized protein LOC112193053 isoform X1 n=1 Tax=Rosa chinensis TaxID=74649 RepID=UPI000D097EB9|nr:uncharacterized protein LOC112193053 isoform X1 [Rosa chinensis]
MKPPSSPISLGAKPRSGRSCICRFFPPASLMVVVVVLLGSAFMLSKFNEQSSFSTVKNSLRRINFKCKSHRRPYGSEPLPRGIVSQTSNLEMQPLWRTPNTPPSKLYQKSANSSISLLAMAVGIKQKDLVGKMVKKFLSSGFVVMLFHYDGNVDEWKQFQWNDLVIHVSAVNQTKWWFAKRFLHPDIVAQYSYIFLWDEDLGVDNFNPQRYVSIVRKEGLEISQPALDFSQSEVHHQITARVKGSTVHRRTYKPNANGTGCDEHSKAPPCTGWIELMAPVFSRAAWRCVWYMIQNNLIHAWGLDMQLGYCAQGNRMKKIGVVDAEYIIHYGRPTLGGPDENEKLPQSIAKDHRVDVRRESYNEMKIFRRKWERAAKNDECWIDPYPVNSSRH